MAPSNDSLGRIATFLAIVAGLSAIIYAPIIAAGSIDTAGGIFTLLLMWVPTIAAFVACRIHREPLRSLGWRPGKPRYLALAYLLPAAYAAIIAGGVWLVGAGTFTGTWPAHLPFYIVIATIGGVVSALGEELGWRGYLVPHLNSAYDFTATALISGLIWAVWHYPILLFTDYGEGGPRWYLLLCFTISVIGISFAAAWLRLRTGSVWPAVLLHASHNLFVLNVFAPLVVQKTTFLLTGEGGLLMAVVGVSLAVVFWLLRSRLKDAESRATEADEPLVGASARGGRPHPAISAPGLKTG